MTEYQKLLEEMNAMPEGLREALAAEFRHEIVERKADPLANLTPAQEARLKRLLQEGIDSGPGKVWNLDAFLRHCHERYDSRLNGEH